MRGYEAVSKQNVFWRTGEMKIISTSDGIVSFNAEGYISHSIGGAINIFKNEIGVVHRDFCKCLATGELNTKYFIFANSASAIMASKEITEQLKQQ